MFWRKNDGICILIIHSYVKYCLICVTKKYEYGQYIFYINMKKTFLYSYAIASLLDVVRQYKVNSMLRTCLQVCKSNKCLALKLMWR